MFELAKFLPVGANHTQIALLCDKENGPQKGEIKLAGKLFDHGKEEENPSKLASNQRTVWKALSK